MRGVNPTLPHFKVCLFLVCPCFKRIFTLAKPLARNVPGTQQQTLHSHSMLPASVMREARQKDNNSGSFDVKTAIANKQPVITKNIFFEFKVSKLRFLYKAAIASGEDVLSRSKKTTPTVCLCSEDNSSLSFSYSAIKKKNKSHCIEYTERFFCQNYCKAHSCSITKIHAQRERDLLHKKNTRQILQ